MAIIRWDNVNGPALGDPSRMLLAAQQGFSGAFDGLSKSLSDLQGANQFAQDQQYGAATLAFKEALNNARTPEELAALQSSGRLDAMRGALNNKGREDVLGAVDNRVASLRKSITEGQAYTEGQTTFAEKPFREAVQAKFAAGDIAGGNALLASRPDARNTAPLITEGYNTGRTREANRLADELAKITAPTALVTAKTSAIDANNTLDDRNLATLTSSAAQQYQQTQLKERLKLAPIAQQMGLPLDSAGVPDVLNMTKEQRMFLDDRAIRAGFKPTSELFSGDTKVGGAFMSSLVASGKYTPEAIARNASKITGAFSTVANGAPVGIDALAIDRAQAQAEVFQKERDSRNRFAPGTPDALTAYEKLATDIEQHPTFKDSPEDLKYVQELLGNISAHGLLIKGQRITPSAQDVMAAVRSTQEGKFFNHSRAADIKEQLIKNLSRSDTTELLKQAEESRLFNRQRVVRDILNPITPAVQPLNPLDLPKPSNTKR